LKYPHLCLAFDTLVPVSSPSANGRGPRFNLDKSNKSKGATLPLLSYSGESGLGRILRTRLGDVLSAPPLSSIFTAHHAVLLKTLALEGRGVAWLPRRLIVDELAHQRLFEAGKSAWPVPLEIRLYRQSSELPTLAESLWRVVASAVAPTDSRSA
jgi:LysR family transcriptional regulator, hypochlorite-specific transcription factor HypT